MSWSEVKKVNSNLNTPLNEGGVKIVKSVQRGISVHYDYIGTYDIIANHRIFYTDITINAVNTSKSIVNVSSI